MANMGLNRFEILRLLVVLGLIVTFGCSGGGGGGEGSGAQDSDASKHEIIFSKTKIDNLTGENIFALAVKPDDPNTIVVSTFGNQYSLGRVFKTTNGGEYWDDINLNKTIGKVLFDPKQTNTIYACGDGLYISQNLGQTWLEHDFEFSYNCLSMAASELSDNIFIVQDSMGYHDGIEVLYPDGTIDTIAKGLNEIYSITNSTDGSGRIFIHCVKGVYMSENDGIDWVQIGDSSELSLFYENRRHSPILISPTDSNKIVIAGGINIYSTTNGGTVWNDITPNEHYLFPDGTDFRMGSEISDIAILSSDEEVILAVYNNFIIKKNWNSNWELVTIIDNPWLKNWTGSNDNSAGVMHYVNQINTYNKGIEPKLYLGTFEGLFSLEANKTNLKALGVQGLTDASVSALLFNPENPDELFIGTRLFGVSLYSDSNSTIKRINSGFTWQFNTISFNKTPSAYINELSTGSPNSDIIACMSGGAYIYNSRDQNWNKLLDGNEFSSELYSFAIDIKDLNRMYAKTGTAFHYTHDGQTWNSHDFMVGNGEVMLDDNNSSIVVVTEHGGSEAFDISTDGGITFSPHGWLLGFGSIIQSIKTNDSELTVYVLKEDALYKVIDISNGNPKSDIILESDSYRDPYVRVAIHPENFDYIAIARTTDILLSINGGQSWNIFSLIKYDPNSFSTPINGSDFHVAFYEGEKIKSLAFSKQEEGVLFVGTSWGLYKVEF